MFFLNALEFVFVIMVFLFVVTQVVLPIINNLPLFPILKHSNPTWDKLKFEKNDVNEDLTVAKAEKLIQDTKDEAKEVRNSW